MMKFKNLLIAGCFLIGLQACGGGSSENGNEPIPVPDEPTQVTPDTPDEEETSFAKGADISWVTEMEADGKKFYNANGKATDCFALMKEIGMNAIRLRVWMNPEYSTNSGLEDVIAKAKRTKDAGMEVMIDFHYSDFFADPSRQNKPKAWEGKSLAELKTAVADYTKEVLNALKKAGITPKWVQVGNETRNGMIWPDGQLWNESGDIANGWSNYAALHNAGYDAVKAVFNEAIVLVHIDNAWDDQDWWFKKFKAAGGKFDMIGLSHYPQTHDTKTWEQMNQLALSHIQTWGATYQCPVMICEVGVKSQDETLAAKVLADFVTKAKALEACAGVFYWEPEVYADWRPAYYEDLGWNAYDMGAFTTDGKPAPALDIFKD